MKVGTSTSNLIPANATLVSSRNTFVGVDSASGRVSLQVEDGFDVDGDGQVDIERRRLLIGDPSMLDGNLLLGGTVEREAFDITDAASGQRILAVDASGAGRLSSVLTFDLKARTVSGEKDLNGDFTVDQKVDMVDGKVRMSTSSRKDGQFDVVDFPAGGFGW